MSRWTATMLVLLATPASAATLCVNPAGSGGCFSSIQAAVDASRSRDVIDIAAGTYAETVLLHDVGRLTLQGAGVGATILKGEPVGATIATLGRVDATIVGVEITDGDEGVFVGDGGRLTLRDSSITDNAGAALRTARKTRVTLDGCVVSGNGGSALSFTTATLHSRGNDLAILRSAIVDNQASGVEAANKVTIVDSTIAGHLLVGVSADKGKSTGSTVSGNGSTRVRVGVSGSGSGSMQIASATISGNAGTGLFVSPGYGA